MIGLERTAEEEISQIERLRIQHHCLILTTYAAQYREAFGQQPSFQSSTERAAARNRYDALLHSALQEFSPETPEGKYIAAHAKRIVDYYSSGYGPK